MDAEAGCGSRVMGPIPSPATRGRRRVPPVDAPERPPAPVPYPACDLTHIPGVQAYTGRAETAVSAIHRLTRLPGMSTPDLKPRSRDVTDGLEKTAARGMLRAVGMGDDDFAKPQIGVASSWNEITPCNLSLQRLAQAVKNGVHAAGGYPLEFGTISVSDRIAMGHGGVHFSLVSREIIADSVETVMCAERLDGSVLLAGCDKSLPGMMMAAARLDLASVFLYAGSIMPGQVDGRDVTIIDAFEAAVRRLRGKSRREGCSGGA